MLDSRAGGGQRTILCIGLADTVKQALSTATTKHGTKLQQSWM